ncbi:serine hydrolase [Nocardioides convexus]|uniref:serine hydrolase n=1 Tax=Nocardioides convexus TaxID=2712224 RepID=UPI0024189299|nr:serine hydrolase [Nocardioides convexus]
MALLQGRTLAGRERARLLGWLRETRTGSPFRTVLPAGWTIADKTGSGDWATRNDVGIAWSPGGVPVLVSSPDPCRRSGRRPARRPCRRGVHGGPGGAAMSVRIAALEERHARRIGLYARNLHTGRENQPPSRRAVRDVLDVQGPGRGGRARRTAGHAGRPGAAAPGEPGRRRWWRARATPCGCRPGRTRATGPGSRRCARRRWPRATTPPGTGCSG